GTLQLQNLPAPMTTEDLTLNGPGYNNAGALENLNGNNTWQRPLHLGSNASIGVDNSAQMLTVNQGIDGLGFGVTKVGPRTLDYTNPPTGVNANTYTGLTQVNQGNLVLDKSAASEVQRLTILGSAGMFTLSFNGQLTGLLAYNVPASGGPTPTSSVQNALM